MSIGIDQPKSELIEFLIEHESFDQFEETEHFYYWFYKTEQVLSDNFGFINKGPYIFKKNDKEFDLNTFEGVARLVIEVQDVMELSKIFNGNFNFGKREYFLRYSKKFHNLEYFMYVHGLVNNKKKTKLFIHHKKHKYFSINEKNYVLVYYNGMNPRYISNKNAAFIRPIMPYLYDYNRAKNKFSEYENYLNSINRRLVSIHQKSKIYNDENFLRSIADLKNVKNTVMLNTNNINELLYKITNGKPVPKILIDKFPKSELVYLYSMINYEEIDKIIKFLYENLEIYNQQESDEKIKSIQFDYKTNYKLHIHQIILDYLTVRFEIRKPDYSKKQFINSDSSNYQWSIIVDYLSMCSTQNLKLNLKIKSYNRLVQEHDRISFSISATNIPAIKPHKKYPKIDSEGDFEIEKIIDKKRLLIESEIQKHCVKTYSHSINSGRCCIYSFIDKRDKKIYTLEIQKKYNESKELVFFLNQIKGKFNAAPSHEVLFEVYGILLRNKVYIDHQSAIKAHKVLFDSLKQEKNKNTILDNPFDDTLILPF
jgi:hypothetical protein